MRISEIKSRLEKGVYLDLPPANGPELPLAVTQYGHDRATGDKNLKCFLSDITVFEFIVSGNMVYHENGTDYLVGAGEMFILQHAIPHEYTVGPAGYAHKRIVSVRSACIDAVLHSVGLNRPQVLRFSDPSAVQALLREMHRGVRQGGDHIHRHLSVLLYRLILEASASSSGSMPIAVQKAIDYMTAHISEKITLDDLVGMCGGSTRHFSRTFKQATGEAPIQWLISLRRNEAVKLICQTDLPIGEIAYRVGYPDPLAFSAYFKKHKGQSPSEMRAKVRSQNADT